MIGTAAGSKVATASITAFAAATSSASVPLPSTTRTMGPAKLTKAVRPVALMPRLGSVGADGGSGEAVDEDRVPPTAFRMASATFAARDCQVMELTGFMF